MDRICHDFRTTGLEVIGKGSRRVCYRMQEAGLCAKFYRMQEEFPPSLGLRFRLRIRVARFCRYLNANYQEWRYYQTLRQSLRAELLAVFPEHIGLAYSPDQGWGLIESLILNADGTLPSPLLTEMANISDPDLRLEIYHSLVSLFSQLEEHAVCFFDLPNTLIQWTGAGTYRLRVADFEPQCRALIPGLSYLKPYVRCKVRRRGQRFLKKVRDAFFSQGETREAARLSRPAKTRARPVAASF